MTQETGGAPAPATDAPASQVEQQTEVEVAKPGSEADPSPAAPESDKPKPVKSGEQLRIDELTRRLRESERRYERVLRIAEERGQPPPPPPTAPATASQPKTLKDFNYDENAYRDHLFTEAANKAATVAEQKARETLQQQERASRRATYESRAESFAKSVEDFDAVIRGDWACSEPMAEVIEASDEGPALAYYLAQNPDVSSKLAKLSAVQAARELTRIEDRLVNERKAALQKPVSKAPPPAPKIEGAGDGSTKAKPDDPASDADLSDAEWTRRRNAQIAARQRARS